MWLSHTQAQIKKVTTEIQPIYFKKLPGIIQKLDDYLDYDNHFLGNEIQRRVSVRF